MTHMSSMTLAYMRIRFWPLLTQKPRTESFASFIAGSDWEITNYRLSPTYTIRMGRERTEDIF